MPTPMLKALIWFALPLLALPLGVYAVAKGRSALPFVAALGILMLVGQAVVFVRFVRLRRRLRAASGRLCPRCGYDLSGLDDAGFCPGCGRGVDLQRGIAKWRRH